MPSDSEIADYQSAHPNVRVLGASQTHDPCRWGEVAVVPFYDHVAEVERSERVSWQNGLALGTQQGAEEMRAACIAAVEAQFDALIASPSDPRVDALSPVGVLRLVRAGFIKAMREVQP